MTRREFIAGAGVLLAGGLFSRGDAEPRSRSNSLCVSAPLREKHLRLGVQLHGIRGVCAKDVRGTLAAIRAMGFEGVDPLAFIAAHPNLGPDAHLTPAGDCALGAAQDRADWRRIIPALAASGVEWAFVKPLAHPDSLADLEASRKWLEKSFTTDNEAQTKGTI